MKHFISLFLSLIILSSVFIFGGDDKKDKCPHEFNMIKQVEVLPVISQGKTGTCWSFATTSFVEAELLRLTGKKIDLSEMYNSKKQYPIKAERYVRLHGNMYISQGGQAHDVIDVIREYGFIPEEVFDGKNIGEEKHNHGELYSVVNGMLEGVVKKRGGKLTKKWKEALNAVLDVYYGEDPETFKFDGKEYTTKSFVESTGFNPDDYIELSSYTHHPFYEPFILELIDNHANEIVYNLPIDEFMSVIDNAIENGYTVTYGGDVSDKHFFSNEGYAVVPVDEKDKDLGDWEKEEKAEEDDELKPEKEKIVTQEYRQEVFDNYTVTDDHLMHITGIAENQEGTKFYYTKNSWGKTKNHEPRSFKGFWYLSEQFVRQSCIVMMVHKNAIPTEILEKLKL